MTRSPGPTTDQEALQEEFLGAMEALRGLGGQWQARELLTWEEAPYEAVKASLLASGQLRTGRGVAATASSHPAPKWLPKPMPISGIPRSASSST